MIEGRVHEKVVKILSRITHVPENKILATTSITPGCRLCRDSFDVIEIVMALDDEFDIDITNPETQKLETVGDITTLVEGKIHI